MFERLEIYFLSEPEKLIQLGRALMLIGGWLIIFSLGGHLATTIANAVGNIGGHVGGVKTLTDIYPSIPTWWVPESFIGILPAVVIACTGIWLSITGMRIQRLLEF